MKLKIMESALDNCSNRFQLTMMAVARAKEINDYEDAPEALDDHFKPVVLALMEIAEGKIVSGSEKEMSRIREAKRILRERSLLEAEEDLFSEEEADDSFASANPERESPES